MTIPPKPCIISFMLINVTKLKSTAQSRQSVQLTEKVDAAAYGYPELNLQGPLQFSGQMENAAPFLELHGTVQARLQLTCSRCLAQFELSLRAEIAEAFTNKPEAMSEDDEYEVGFFSGDEIDVAPALLKALLLELPMQPLCQPDCLGLCPDCGADLNRGKCNCNHQNIDIRFSKLQSLLQSMQAEDNRKEV